MSTEAARKALAQDAAIVQQRWRRLTFSEVQRVLDALEKPLRALRICAHSARPTAAGALVLTDHGGVFIKRYNKAIRSIEQILPYHHLVAHLVQRGIAVPPFLSFRSGLLEAHESVLQLGNCLYEVCTQGVGEDRYRTTLTWQPPASASEAYELGRFMARAANAMADFCDGVDDMSQEPQSSAQSFTQSSYQRSLAQDAFRDHFGLFASSDFTHAWQRWIAARPRVAAYLAATQRDVLHDTALHQTYARQLSALYPLLPSAWTHGDPHVSNLLWQGERPTTLFDFGLAARNTAVFDLVELIERNCIQFTAIEAGNDAACRPDLAAAMIRGWQRERALTPLERSVIPLMLPVAQAEAALNWIGYYAHGVGTRSDADWCYDTMLLQHTAWFARPSGVAFLQALQHTLQDLP